MQSGVDTISVGVEHGLPLRLGTRVGLLGDMTESVHANLCVGFEGAGSDQCAQLAGGLAALQVHLEKTILRVEEAEGARDVRAGSAGDRRHAERVARDGHGRRQSGERDCPLEPWQAGPKLGADVAAAGHCGQSDDNEKCQQDAADEAHEVIIVRSAGADRAQPDLPLPVRGVAPHPWLMPNRQPTA